MKIIFFILFIILNTIVYGNEIMWKDNIDSYLNIESDKVSNDFDKFQLELGFDGLKNNIWYWPQLKTYSLYKNTMKKILSKEKVLFMTRIEVGNGNDMAYDFYWLIETKENCILYYAEDYKYDIKQKFITKTKLEQIKKLLLDNDIDKLKTNVSRSFVKDGSCYYISYYNNGQINQFAILSPIIDYYNRSEQNIKIYNKTKKYINIINIILDCLK